MNGHQKWKIITGFSLCPALGGLILGGTVLVNSLVDPSRNEGVFFIICIGLAFTFSSILVATFFYIVPAFFLSLIYVFLKLSKGIFSYLFVSICGGGGAALWCRIVFPKAQNGNPLLSDFGVLPIAEPSGAFLWGAATSLIMAFVALPKIMQE